MARKSKKKRILLTLSEREWVSLDRYAAAQGIRRSTAIKHILKEQLQNYLKNEMVETPKNQLELFDTLQIDIFNNISKL